MKPFTTKFVSSLFIGMVIVTTLCGQPALPEPWFTNRRVDNLATGDGKVFIRGGEWFGTQNGNGLAVFNNELTHDSSYPSSYSVRLSIPDDAGGWYIAGHSVISHIKADKTLEELPITFTGGGFPITAIDKIGNILYIAGQFTAVNNVPRSYLASIDLTTNTLTSWNPGASGYVYTLKASGSTIYVGGSFASVGGQTRAKIAAIDATTGLATSWNANVTTGSGYVYTIDVGPTEVYFGGSFANVAGASPTRRNFAAVTTASGALTAFNPRPDDNVSALLLDGNTLYMGGQFALVAGVAKSGLAAFNVATGLLTSFATTLNTGFDDNYNVYDFAVDGQKLFVGGNFLTINETERAHLAVVDKTTGVLEPMDDRGLSNYVLTVSVSGGKVLVGGGFDGISGITSSVNMFALDDVTGQGTAWRPQMPYPPTGEYFYDVNIHYQDERVYYWQVVSDNTSVLGAVNSTDGAAIGTWAVSLDGRLAAWAFSDNALYLAGEFTQVNGVPRNGFAAVDLVTGAALPWTISYSVSPGEYITSLAVHNDVLYVAGGFIFTDGGVERDGWAAWNATTGAIHPWSPSVEALSNAEGPIIGAVNDSHVYIIGNYVMRRVDTLSGDLDDEWVPSVGGDISALAIYENSVFVAGGFSPGLVRLDIANGEPIGVQPEYVDIYESEGSIDALAVSGTKLFVGGGFSYEVNGEYRSNFAVYEIIDGPTAVIADAELTTCSDVNATLSVEATGTVFNYQWQKRNEENDEFEDIADSDQYDGVTTAMLTIVTADEFVIGDYRCWVSTEQGSVFSNVATLIVTEPCNQPPVIVTQALETYVGGIIDLDLIPLITTESNNLDPNSITVLEAPSSGAVATIVDGVLTIDYTGVAFSGTEMITIRACTIYGNCTDQQFSIEVAGDIFVYNGISPDGANPALVIRHIELLPETKDNRVTIYDRWQNEVWRGTNYDNTAVTFKGTSDKGSELPTGTYFYKIEFSSGRKTQTGFISLKR
jgi:hypothetical protein